MARKTARLTALGVSKLTKPGYYGDGGGLWLQVSATGSKSWVYRFSLNGRAREMGLGPLRKVPLASARACAQSCGELCQQGIDPIDAKRAKQAQAALDTAKAVTFGDCATRYIEAHRAGWRNAKHAAQWQATLDTYAKPVIGSLAVQAVDTGLVLNVLEPIWNTKPETAGRVRGRIESILDWARVRGFRSGENPARWRGHLDKLLPRKSKVRAVQHHPALPYGEVPQFMTQLRQQQGMAAQCLEFVILTACRTGEAIGATRNEVNSKDRTWTIPGSRMKAGKEHRVPLSDRAMQLAQTDSQLVVGEFLFLGGVGQRGLSNMALTALLRRMGRDGITVHGFRSAFRDWAAETTAFPNEVVEMALAHVIGNAAEAAYRRGDLFEKRRRLMEAWADYCAHGQSSAEVIPLRSASPDC